MSSQDSIDINHEMFKNLKVDELKYWDKIIVKLKNQKMSDGFLDYIKVIVVITLNYADIHLVKL